MNLSVDISVDDRAARRFLRNLVMTLDSQGVKEVAGRAGANLIQRHIRGLDQQRANKLGGRRSHFYSKAAASTHFKTTSTGALVSVTQLGFAQRYFGGVIRASGRASRVTGKPITRLAIPSRAVAYGTVPADWSGLFVLRLRGVNRAALARRDGNRLVVYFWLVSSVTQRPDASVMPADDAIRSAALSAVETYITRQIERAGK